MTTNRLRPDIGQLIELFFLLLSIILAQIQCHLFMARGAHGRTVCKVFCSLRKNLLSRYRLKHHADHVDHAFRCPRLLRGNCANALCHPLRTAGDRRKPAGRIFSTTCRKRICPPVLGRRRCRAILVNCSNCTDSSPSANRFTNSRMSAPSMSLALWISAVSSGQ